MSINKPSLIPGKGRSFLICDAPTDNNLHLYIKEFEKHNVTHIVNVSNSKYNVEALEAKNIVVHNWPFDDGKAPPDELIQDWLDLIKSVPAEDTIAVHCVAGLGRAPVLVAISLIKSGMDALSAVEFIRERRRGAINQKQLEFLEQYEKRKKGKCIIL